MSHKSKVSLNEQLRQRLSGCLAIGRSRNLDKRSGIDCKQFIYSWGSYKAYFKQGNGIVDFVSEIVNAVPPLCYLGSDEDKGHPFAKRKAKHFSLIQSRFIICKSTNPTIAYSG